MMLRSLLLTVRLVHGCLRYGHLIADVFIAVAWMSQVLATAMCGHAVWCRMRSMEFRRLSIAIETGTDALPLAATRLNCVVLRLWSLAAIRTAAICKHLTLCWVTCVTGGAMIR